MRQGRSVTRFPYELFRIQELSNAMQWRFHDLGWCGRQGARKNGALDQDGRSGLPPHDIFMPRKLLVRSTAKKIHLFSSFFMRCLANQGRRRSGLGGLRLLASFLCVQVQSLSMLSKNMKRPHEHLAPFCGGPSEMVRGFSTRKDIDGL